MLIRGLHPSTILTHLPFHQVVMAGCVANLTTCGVSFELLATTAEFGSGSALWKRDSSF